jgi:hypothetical protein
MLHGGKPANMEEFISKILQQAGVIYAANEEMQACGINYRPISKTVEDPFVGKRAMKLEANRLKNEERDKVRLPKFGGGPALPEFVCNGCGGKGHAYKQCPKSKYKDFNSGKLAWAKSDAGKRLMTFGKSSISEDKPTGAKPRGTSNYAHDAPLLAALCAANNDYLVSGALQGTSANATNPINPPLTVQVLPDTGAVLDNYCLHTVGDWVRLHYPDDWSADVNNDPVNLACIGTSAVPTGI